MRKHNLNKLYFILVGLLTHNPVQGLNFSNITSSTEETSLNTAYEQAKVNALSGIMATLKSDFTKAYQAFSGDVATASLNKGKFSDQNFTDFNSLVDQKLKDFNASCDSAKLIANNSYAKFLTDQGRSTLTGDETAQKLSSSITEILGDFQEKVAFFKTMMLSGATLDNLSKDLESKIDLFDAQYEATFLNRQKSATAKTTRTIWENLDLFMTNLAPQLEKQLLDDLGKTIGAVLETQLGKMGTLVAEYLGDLTTILSDIVKDKAQELLEKIGETLTPEFEKILEKIMPVLDPLLKLIGKKLENASLELLEKLLKEIIKDYFKPEHDFKNVEVRTSMDLCDDEKAFITARTAKTTAVLKEAFGINVPLKIAMMSSGGGLRATFGYSGFALAAEEAKIWDASLYSVGLSGSTWNVMPYSYAFAKNGTTLAEYRDFLVSSDLFTKDFPDFSGGELGGIGTWLLKEYGYELLFSSADVFGAVPAHGCVMGDQTTVKISDIAEKIKEGGCPLPICAAVFYAGNARTKTTTSSTDTTSEESTTEKVKISDEELDKVLEEILEDFTDKPLSQDDLDKILEETAEDLKNDDLDGALAETTDDIPDVDKNSRQLGKLSSTTSDSTSKTDAASTEASIYQQVKDALAASGKDAEKYTKQTEYNWLELTPFEVGGVDLAGFIPQWAWGAAFNNGKPVDTVKGKIPEYPLYNLMGVWGSAYAITANDVIDRIPEKLPQVGFNILGTDVKLPVGDWISTYFDTVGVAASEARLLSPIYFNYSQGLSGSALKDSETIEVLDAGMDSNMPFPMLMNRDARKMDVIFMFHADPGTAVIFETIVVHFKRKGIKYPAAFDSVTEESLSSQPMTVFNDPRATDYVADLPTFIYFPFLNCPEHAKNTFNFVFTGDQISETITAAQKMFTDQVPEITKVLKALAVKKGDTALTTTEVAEVAVTPADAASVDTKVADAASVDTKVADAASVDTKVADASVTDPAEVAAPEEVAPEESSVEDTTTKTTAVDADALFDQLIANESVTDSTKPATTTVDTNAVSSVASDSTTTKSTTSSDSIDALLSILYDVQNNSTV